jgi:hypothetical protein
VTRHAGAAPAALSGPPYATDFRTLWFVVPSRRGVSTMKPGRNDPCPCGSGKKFKKCCLGSGSYDDPFISWLRRTPREAAVSGVAALLFHGDGPWRAHSIERAACMAWLVATDSAPAAGTIDPNQLSTLLAASPLIEGWRTLDDPPESALVDAITCVGGDCLVYPGPSYEAIFALKLLFRAFGASPLESTLGPTLCCYCRMRSSSPWVIRGTTFSP